MKLLLRLSRAIDWLNERVGRLVYWLVLAAVLISSANATSRYLLNKTSNGCSASVGSGTLRGQ